MGRGGWFKNDLWLCRRRDRKPNRVRSLEGPSEAPFTPYCQRSTLSFHPNRRVFRCLTSSAFHRFCSRPCSLLFPVPGAPQLRSSSALLLTLPPIESTSPARLLALPGLPQP